MGECLKEKGLFLTSLKQTCSEYLIKFSENQSAPKLENRKTSPCSPCAPNLPHVLLSRIPGYHNLCSPVRNSVGRQLFLQPSLSPCHLLLLLQLHRHLSNCLLLLCSIFFPFLLLDDLKNGQRGLCCIATSLNHCFWDWDMRYHLDSLHVHVAV